MKVAAVSILCQDNRVFSAMAHAGTPCPFNGKIGDSALEEWNKYDQQRPDYEEYTKALRYMEKVDNKILEGLDEKEAYITDGNGNPVKLGSEYYSRNSCRHAQRRRHNCNYNCDYR